MTARTRIDVDVVYQEGDARSITVDYLTEHIAADVTNATSFTGTAGTSAVSIAGTAPLSTLAVQNTGSSVLRVAGVIDVPAGRLAILPVTATVTVAAPSGSGKYSAIWIG